MPKKKPPVKKAPPKKRAPVKKKRQPVQKKKAKKKAAKKAVEEIVAEEVIGALTAEEQEHSFRTLRWMAGQYYATNLNQCSIADMANHPIFSAVSKKAMEEWSAKDHWVEKRHEVQERIRAKVENALASEIVQHRSNQLKTMQNIFDDAIGQLLPQYEERLDEESGQIVQVQVGYRPEVKSYEGLVNAITKLANFMDGMRERLGEVIVPQVTFDEPTAAASMPVKPQLTETEARAAAKLLIKMRQEELKRRQEEHDKAKEVNQEKQQPTLRVVDGE